MNIHYKIVELWPDDHLIVARYWTDIISEESLASDLNRKEDGTPVRCRSDVSLNLPVPVPDAEEIDKILMRNAPAEWLKLLENVKDPNVNTDSSAIASMMNIQKSTTYDDVKALVIPVPVVVTETEQEPKELTDEEIQNLINNLK